MHPVAALILAGGTGTRFGRLGQMLPKTLATIGDQSILQRLIGQCRDAGIEDIFVLSSKRFAPLIGHAVSLGDDAGRIEIVQEEEPRGSANALVTFASRFIDRGCLLVLGDEYFEDGDAFKEIHLMLKQDTPPEMILGVIPATSVATMGCNIICDEDGAVVRIIDKPAHNEIRGDIRWGCIAGFSPGALSAAADAMERNTLRSPHIGDALEAIRAAGAVVSTVRVTGAEYNVNSAREALLASLVEIRRNGRDAELMAALRAALMAVEPAV